MQYIKLISSLILLALLSGCSGSTAIKNLTLPPVSTIQGTVTSIEADGFTLKDSTASIFVRSKLQDGKKLDISLTETLTVYGNLQGGAEKIFDGYVIRKETGEQIIITRPTPHIGFILQTSFD